MADPITARVYQEHFPHPGNGRWYFEVKRGDRLMRTGGGHFLEAHARRDLSNFARHSNLVGEDAYMVDLVAHPTYHDGTPRKAWDKLDKVVRSSWEQRHKENA